MRESNNPYQPPTDSPKQAAAFSSDRIDIDGAVTVDDIAQLIRTPWILRLSRVVVVIFMGAFLYVAVQLSILLPAANRRGILLVLVAAASFALVMFALDRIVSRSRRAKRLVRRHPGLIGPFNGYLDEFGLTFFNEGSQQYQQYSWAAFPSVDVTDSGIRLDWRTTDAAFIAVPSKCIGGFSETLIRTIIDSFRASAKEPAVFQRQPNWDLTPKDAMRFENHVLLQPPASRRQTLTYYALTLLSYLLVSAGLAMVYFGVHVLWIILLIAASILAGSYQLKLWATISPKRFVIRQWGWMTPKETCVFLPNADYHFQWTDISELDVGETTVTGKFANNTVFAVSRADLLPGSKDAVSSEEPGNDDAWSRLLDWIAASEQAAATATLSH